MTKVLPSIGNDLERTNTKLSLSVRLSKGRGKGKEKDKIEEGYPLLPKFNFFARFLSLPLPLEKVN